MLRNHSAIFRDYVFLLGNGPRESLINPPRGVVTRAEPSGCNRSKRCLARGFVMGASGIVRPVTKRNFSNEGRRIEFRLNSNSTDQVKEGRLLLAINSPDWR